MQCRGVGKREGPARAGAGGIRWMGRGPRGDRPEQEAPVGLNVPAVQPAFRTQTNASV